MVARISRGLLCIMFAGFTACSSGPAMQDSGYSNYNGIKYNGATGTEYTRGDDVSARQEDAGQVNGSFNSSSGKTITSVEK